MSLGQPPYAPRPDRNERPGFSTSSSDAQPTVNPVRSSGSLFAGRYRVDRLLGKGQRKETFLAWDTKASRPVALALVAREDDQRATLQEVEMLGLAGPHDNIVTLYDFDLESKPQYLVFEYLPGGQLRDRCRDIQSEGKHIPLGDFFRLARQLCRALAQIHQRGIIHRDISSTNIWLDERGVAHVGDFDTAISLDEGAAGAGGSSTTEGYPAPEVTNGGPQDTRADVYSLGAVLYELLVGDGPRPSSDPLVAFDRPSASRYDVPPRLDTLILSMLALDRAGRPTGVLAVLGVLREIEATANLESLVAKGENPTVEFKQTMRWDIELRKKSEEVLRSSVKTVCAFLNNVGGTLLIGVANGGRLTGLDDDLKALDDKDKGPGTVDRLELAFRQALVKGLDPEMSHLVTLSFPLVDGVQLCRVDVEPAPLPVFLVGKDVSEFYVRKGNASRPLDVKAVLDYVPQHWGRATG